MPNGRIAERAGTTFASLRQRNFRLYFIGQAISLTGSWMDTVALSILVLRLSSSGTALGLVVSLQFAPTLFLGPYAGVVADRVPKRRLLLFTQATSGVLAATLATLVITGSVRMWMVYALAGTLGMVNALDFPTRQSFVYELAGPEAVLSAVGLNGAVVNLARVVGPALAGVLIATLSIAVCFYINAASFVAVIVFMLLMRASEFYAPPLRREAKGLSNGFRYALRTPVVFESLAMMLLVGTFTYEFSVTLPLLAHFSFAGSSAAGLAYLMSSMGLGATLGGLVTAGRRTDGLGRLAATAFAFGVGTAAAGFAPTLPVATVLMFFVGVFSARFTALSNGLLQLCSSTEMRSRMMALWSTAFFGSTFVGGPLVGWIGEHAGPEWGMAVGAVGGVVAALIGWIGSRRERALPEGRRQSPCPSMPGR